MAGTVSVLNTDAGLSGKTIVNGEDSQTVTGLKTFDRDPSAPFAVSSGSAKVDNLDADKLDGQDGSYYTNAANLTGTIAAISGANLTNLNASNLASGTVPTASLGSGTANSTTFLRGDQTWAKLPARLLATDDTQATNSGTTETALYTLTIPANTLDANGVTVRFYAVGSLAANANAKNIKLRWGGAAGTIICTYVQNTASLTQFDVVARITRQASNSQRLVGTVTFYAGGSSGAPQYSLNFTTDTKTDTSSIDLVLTGTSSAASSDITYEASWTEVLRVG